MNDIVGNGANSDSYGIISEYGGESFTVPSQIYQDIFKRLNEIIDSSDEYFSNDFQIEFSDIENLHHKIQQTIGPFECHYRNVDFVIYYVDDTKDVVNSFEHAAKLSASSVSQVESIFISYKFLIKSSVDDAPRPYAIKLRIVSPIALASKLRGISFAGPPSIMRLMGTQSAHLKIEYSDYTIARSLKLVVKEWFSTVKKAESPGYIRYFQRKSHFIPVFSSILTVSISILMLMYEIKKRNIENFNDFYQYMIITTLFLFLCYNASRIIGRYSEYRIDSWMPLSYIEFNKKDKIEIGNIRKLNSNNLAKSFFSAIASAIISFPMKFLVTFLIDFVKN